MSLSVQDIVQGVQAADAAFDAIAPELGVGDLQPLADALTALLAKVTSAIAGTGTSLTAEVQVAETQADALEDAKLGPGK